MAIMCAVGDGLQDDPTFVSELLAAIGGVPIRMVSQAAARRNITLVIQADDLAPTLERVHERFFAGTVLVDDRGPDMTFHEIASAARSWTVTGRVVR